MVEMNIMKTKNCPCGVYITARQSKLHDGFCPNCDDRPLQNPRDL